MTERPIPPTDWIEAAVDALNTLGLGTGFAGMPRADWDRVCDGVARTLPASGVMLPDGWRPALAQRMGRRGLETADPDELARDEADTVLAERGEVFGTEDDA